VSEFPVECFFIRCQTSRSKESWYL